MIFVSDVWAKARTKALERENRELKQANEILRKGETILRNLGHARIVIAARAADNNTERPHSSLEYQTTADFARTLTIAIARLAAQGEAPRVGPLLNRRQSE
ncbi:hypothetical protein GGR17_000875 [Confluentimicrobium naphthalenivorans]|uniref:Integrase catalytic domain-containing protein n=1 Tax=Actibacterium naphthalenivorans TaxID=1614693 RepID=A0A840C5H5_9RHOB|nr:hypothetical protein [Actibacterium naphthalenivorans]